MPLLRKPGEKEKDRNQSLYSRLFEFGGGAGFATGSASAKAKASTSVSFALCSACGPPKAGFRRAYSGCDPPGRLGMRLPELSRLVDT